jgi:hypothetical protein
VSGDGARLRRVARRHDAVVRSHEVDGGGWRWRVAWRGVEAGAWNDMDGVAVVADIGPWDEWVGLRGHPADPTATAALEWVIATLSGWLDDPANAERIATRTRSRPPDQRS